MTKEDIIGGLKNALERGATMETAMNSMISAGYNPQEVRAAAASLSGITPIVNQTKPIAKNMENVVQRPNPLTKNPQTTPSQSMPSTRTSVPQQSPVNVIEPRPTPTYQNAERFSVPLPSQNPPTADPIGKLTIIILLFLLMLFIGGLVTIIVFKEDLVNFILKSYEI